MLVELLLSKVPSNETKIVICKTCCFIVGSRKETLLTNFILEPTEFGIQTQFSMVKFGILSHGLRFKLNQYGVWNGKFPCYQDTRYPQEKSKSVMETLQLGTLSSFFQNLQIETNEVR